MVSRKYGTVKISTQKRMRIGKKWNSTAHLLEKYYFLDHLETELGLLKIIKFIIK